MQNFQRLAKGLNVDPLIWQINNNSELWLEHTARQDTPGSPHTHTETIFLRWAKEMTVDAVFNDLDAVNYKALKTLSEANKLIASLIIKTEAQALGRVIIAKLKPGHGISPHADEGNYADHYERFHICLESEIENSFMVGDSKDESGEFVRMKPGEAWWFNHKKEHWAINDSQSPRVHMIVDLVAPKFRRERA